MQKSVIQYLDKTVSLYPQKIAVVDSLKRITFEELRNVALQIGLAIKEKNIHSSPVSVYLPKSCSMVECFAGINASGNFYVPLDVKSPDSRVKSILTVLKSELVITDRLHAEKLKTFYNLDILVLEDIIDKKTEISSRNLSTFVDTQIDTDPVYAIFTSGSTGTPKGVVISHRGVIDYIDWAVETFNIGPETVIGNQAPFYFDNSTLDIYLMYATGATLNIIPENCFIFPSKLVDYLNDNKITFVFWVPFVLVNMANLDIFSSKKPLYLTDVFFAGEVMPNKHLNYWRKHLPSCRYVNLYGPTEITVDCTYYEVKREFSDSEPLPIGFPCKNSDVLIMVDRKRLAINGEKGELCVRGSSLALGYYNNWEKTRESFIQNPLQCNYPEYIYCTGDMVYKNALDEIMYVGRIDSQIKHNGYRIELGEIEAAALATNLIENCCVCYDFANKKIVMFFQSNLTVDIKELRKKLIVALPKYMLPTDFKQVDVLKQNGSGKIDRSYYNQSLIIDA